MPRFWVHIAIRHGLFNRWFYRTRLKHFARPLPGPERDLDLVSFSSSRDLPEQVLSIRSFFRHVGLPKSIRIFSDGSHSPEERALLRNLHPSLTVVDYTTLLGPHLPPAVQAYAANQAMGKKLVVMSSMKVNRRTIYADSDILFFPGAAEIGDITNHPSRTPRYLLDCWPSLDDRLLRDESERQTPVNAGFFILEQPLDWTEAWSRWATMVGEPKFFTEQTTVNITMKRAGGEPLPPDRYVMQNKDQYDLLDHYTQKGVVLRHYISSIRYKMWARLSQPAGPPLE
ncbi:MAG TPA: hypothetical protein VMF06_16925 [Candidatus Limnocylindria bacterium]|nr:hypothetical protein [Candidatus Limnocylindria bacterium]